MAMPSASAMAVSIPDPRKHGLAACLALHEDVALPDGGVREADAVRLRACLRTSLEWLNRLREETATILLPAFPPAAQTPDPYAVLRADRAELLEGFEQIHRETVAVIEADTVGLTLQRLEKLEADAREGLTLLSQVLATVYGDVNVVVRGGASMGSYQAGFLYYVTEVLKARRRLLGLERAVGSVTGASAGAINSLLISLESCSDAAVEDPTKSLFFQVWVPVGLWGRHGAPGLFGDGRRAEDPLAVLSSAPLERTMDHVQVWSEKSFVPPPRRCFADLAMTVTHFDSIAYPIHYTQDGEGKREVLLQAQRQAESFAFALESGGPKGGAPEFRPLRPTRRRVGGHGTTRSLLEVREAFPVLGDDFESAADLRNHRYELRDLMVTTLASAAFPAAFRPVALDFTRFDRDEKVIAVKRGVRFVDGGVFNNTPVGLGVELSTWREARRVKRTPIEESGLRDLMDAVPQSYLFLEPSLIEWKPQERPKKSRKKEKKRRGILGSYLRFARSIIGTALGAQLIETAERYPWVRRAREDRNEPAITIPKRRLPVTSQQLESFMGFFERDFRIYDFHVGIADAMRYVGSDVVLSNLPTPKVDSQKLACLQDYYAARSTLPKIVEGKDLPERCQTLGDDIFPDYSARKRERLARAVGPKVGEDWSKLSPAKQRKLAKAERYVEQKNFARVLVAMHNYRTWTESAQYTKADEFKRFVQVLADADFVWTDMRRAKTVVLSRLNERGAKMAIREEIGRAVDRVARAQETRSERTRVALIGDVVADQYRPRWPAATLGIGFNGILGAEVWAGLAPVVVPLRLDVGARLHRWRIRESTDSETMAVENDLKGHFATFSRLVAGLVRTPLVGWEVGAGGVFSLPFLIGDNTGSLPFLAGLDFSTAITIVKHLYLDLQVDWFLRSQKSDDVQFSVGVGWRFNG